MKEILALQKITDKESTHGMPVANKQSHFSWFGCGIVSHTCNGW